MAVSKYMAPFSIREVFKAGWRDIRAHSGLVFGVVLTLLALQVLQAMVGKTLEGEVLGGIAEFVLGIAGAVAGVGATIISLKLAEHKHAEYRDIIPSWGILWRFFVSSVLVALIVMAALIPAGAVLIGGGMVSFSEGGVSLEGLSTTIVIAVLLALPAIYLALRWSMVRFAIVDGADVGASLKQSWHMTRGALPKLILFAVAAVALNILGAIPFGIGLFLTIPLTMLALAHVYLKLKHRHHAE